jgi:alpha-amylase/alpha-mannosidase (GH57 family)
MSWQELRYRPHIARHGDDEIIVVVRDRELSDAQESGMDPDWFVNEIAERTRWCDFPPLVTTATDGENGGWFRNVTEGANYWSAFYRPLLDRVRAGEANLRPTFIPDYLNTYGARGEVRVATGAWNTGWHHGKGFTQWTGSEMQRTVLARYGAVSEQLQDLLRQPEPDAAPDAVPDADASAPERFAERLEEARWHLLRAETSCNIFWGEAWCNRADEDLDIAEQLLAGLAAESSEAADPPACEPVSDQ